MCKGSRYCDLFDTSEGGSQNPDDDDLSDDDYDDYGDFYDDDDDSDPASRCVEEALTTSITTHSGNAATG